MEVIFEITNEDLFNEKVIDVDTSGLTRKDNSFIGSLAIVKEDGNGYITITGEFGTNDYKDELGFVLKNQ